MSGGLLCIGRVPHMSTSCVFFPSLYFLLNGSVSVLHFVLPLFVPSWAELSTGAVKNIDQEITTHNRVLVVFKSQLIFMEICLCFMTAGTHAKDLEENNQLNRLCDSVTHWFYVSPCLSFSAAPPPASTPPSSPICAPVRWHIRASDIIWVPL